eukprot:TRINITY_DN42625_c0_g1_i1.p1 TRINITY_DN42625_c0_g1~~TRINITY_DN42625_c0_g1_i1.p1  ORF type:complete len:130 (-),score=16.92 TRINITY_DN42625_c0_g1_i1:260-649(-)
MDVAEDTSFFHHCSKRRSALFRSEAQKRAWSGLDRPDSAQSKENHDYEDALTSMDITGSEHTYHSTDQFESFLNPNPSYLDLADTKSKCGGSMMRADSCQSLDSGIFEFEPDDLVSTKRRHLPDLQEQT